MVAYETEHARRRVSMVPWVRRVAMLAFAFGACGKTGTPVTITRGKLLMGTLFEVTVVSPESTQARSWLDSAFAEIERIERLTSDYDTASFVGRINEGSERAAHIGGTPHRVARLPDELFAMLQRGTELRDATAGAFDITVGTATHLWRQAEARNVPPSPEELAVDARRIGPDHLRLDPSGRSLTLDPGTELDLGGIAKGYAVDRTLGVLRRVGASSALVNGGGDIAAFGAPPGRTSWAVGIRHPQKGPMEYFGVIYLTGGAVASSGDYERGYAIGDSVYGHIFDPHTAQAATRSISTTIIAQTCEMADALSTGAFVLGPDSGRAVLARIAGVEGLIVVEGHGKPAAYLTAGFLTDAAIDTMQVRVIVPSEHLNGGGGR